MSPSTESLQTLAARCRRGEPGAAERLGAELEAGLLPLMHHALRRGAGLPVLDRFLRRSLPGYGGDAVASLRSTPDADPSRLARQLCAELVRQFRPGGGPALPSVPVGALETVIGP
jgi:hypothetical protein